MINCLSGFEIRIAGGDERDEAATVVAFEFSEGFSDSRHSWLRRSRCL